MSKSGASKLLMRAALGAAAIAALVGGLVVSQAVAQETTVAVQGKINGGEFLTNSVWEEAGDPANRRYTFRQRSVTVSKETARLTSYLPKELCIVAEGPGAKPTGTPMDIYVSGGRTTPVTLVVATGQNVRFVNADPFDHQLYDVKGEGGGMAPEPTKSGEQRIWQPQKAGVYEIRDKLFPSVRSWIVVADNVVSQTHPKRDGSFTLGGLVEGSYTLQAYHEGQKTGEPMPIEVRGLPDLQPLIKPLVVAKKGDKPEKEIGEEGDE